MCTGAESEVEMSRWLAYSGSPVLPEDPLYKPENSLVVQSKHSRLGVETTNGDGFGVADFPSLKRNLTLAVEPALYTEIEGSTTTPSSITD